MFAASAARVRSTCVRNRHRSEHVQFSRTSCIDGFATQYGIRAMIDETLMIATRTERGSRGQAWSFFHFVPARYTARRVTASQSVSNLIDQEQSLFL